MKSRNLSLYLLVLLLITAVVIAAAGGGIFGQPLPWWLQWQHRAFDSLCHQMPGRSFWLGGQPMAVCARCFGVYAGFGTGWLMLGLLPLMFKGNRLRGRWLLSALILVNVADIVGNMLGFWENTLVTRAILGGGLGFAATVLFAGTFFYSVNNHQTEDYYGRISTRGSGT